MKTMLKRLLATGVACCLVLIMFYTSIHVIAFNIGYYENEYLKFGIHESIDVSPQNLRTVTEHMLDYLKGQKPDLVVYTEVAGVEREFFNETEKYHMVDVANLFANGYTIRNIALVIFVMFLGALVISGEWVRPLFRAIQVTSGVLLASMSLLAALIFTNFSRYFTLFHEVFFDNDLWLLDPDTDLLLNIVPEGFFIDTAIYVTVIFVSLLIICCITSTVVLKKSKKGI